MRGPIRNPRRLVTVLLVAALLGGCTTLFSKHRDGVGYPFAGMSNTPENFECYKIWSPVGWLLFTIAVIDIPLSFVADLLFLPIDLAFLKSEPKKGSTTCA